MLVAYATHIYSLELEQSREVAVTHRDRVAGGRSWIRASSSCSRRIQTAASFSWMR